MSEEKAQPIIEREKTKQFIEKAKIVHGEKYDYSKTVYVNYKTKVKIFCKNHKTFFNQDTKNHLNGNGCPKCASDDRKKPRISIDDFKKRSNEKHNNFYDYSDIEYKGTQVKVKIKCPVHGFFWQHPFHHMDGTGCKNCAVEARNKGITLTTDIFIAKSEECHGKLYDYSKSEYVKATSKIIIICNIHGEFSQIASDHMRGYGCPTCGKERSQKKQALTTDEFIAKAEEKHGKLYDYSKVTYVNADTKVIIVCKIHGDFLQAPGPHMYYREGCPKCAAENMGNLRRLTMDEFIKRAEEQHGKLYDYSKTVYISSNKPVIIICSIHGDFSQSPNYHFKGGKCWKCNLCPTCEIWKTLGKMCSYCQPLEKNKHFMKTKEMRVVKYLRENITEHEFIHNRSVGSEHTGTHLYPDIRFDCDHYNIIVEIDEKEHRGYNCEEKRMLDIILKLMTPCIFIRYNPDNKNSNEKVLVDTIKKYFDISPDDNTNWNDHGFSAVYLFYERNIINNCIMNKSKDEDYIVDCYYDNHCDYNNNNNNYDSNKDDYDNDNDNYDDYIVKYRAKNAFPTKSQYQIKNIYRIKNCY